MIGGLGPFLTIKICTSLNHQTSSRTHGPPAHKLGQLFCHQQCLCTTPHLPAAQTQHPTTEHVLTQFLGSALQGLALSPFSVLSLLWPFPFPFRDPPHGPRPLLSPLIRLPALPNTEAVVTNNIARFPRSCKKVSSGFLRRLGTLMTLITVVQDG
jgi:hypothetical protein